MSPYTPTMNGLNKVLKSFRFTYHETPLKSFDVRLDGVFVIHVNGKKVFESRDKHEALKKYNEI